MYSTAPADLAPKKFCVDWQNESLKSIEDLTISLIIYKIKVR